MAEEVDGDAMGQQGPIEPDASLPSFGLLQVTDTQIPDTI